MIVAVACFIDGEVHALPAPARHHDVLHQYPLTMGHEHGEQGFIDHDLGYVNRKIAGEIAIKEGQIEKLKWPPDLYSEDLW